MVIDSGEVSTISPLSLVEILLSARGTASALSNMGFSELNPFSQLAYGPSSNCLRLKVTVTCYPPRLATSEWLVLTRWESHPLYVTTLLSRSPLFPFPSFLCHIVDTRPCSEVFYAFRSYNRCLLQCMNK